MPARRSSLEPILRAVAGTAPFAEYCAARSLGLDDESLPPSSRSSARSWAAVITALPANRRATLERELARVGEMADPEASAHLVDAAAGIELPPDDVPAGAPVALWFLIRRPDLFNTVFLHHEVRAIDTWRTARAPPGLSVGDCDRAVPVLAADISGFFRRHEAIGRFCEVEAFTLSDTVCFVAHLADRPLLLDAFTDRGKRTARRVRPSVRVTLAYDPRDGTILVNARIRSRDRLLDLVRRFARAVLGVELPDDCLSPAFDLEPLKRPFTPLPDGPDMESARVKAIHLSYPAVAGRRVIKLETRASDDAAAIPDLFRAHLGAAGALDAVRVTYAEIQVRLRVEGGTKSYVVRLSPDRCNLDRSPVGERLRACLRRWGLCHAG